MTPAYERTIHELNANALYSWFRSHGPQFGWQSVDNVDMLQSAANAAKCASSWRAMPIMLDSGHISVVVPNVTDGRRNAVTAFCFIQSNRRPEGPMAP